jgi:hypothetical protein
MVPARLAGTKAQLATTSEPLLAAVGIFEVALPFGIYPVGDAVPGSWLGDSVLARLLLVELLASRLFQ